MPKDLNNDVTQINKIDLFRLTRLTARVHARLGEVVLYATPSHSFGPRRGKMGSQDCYRLPEYQGNRIGMFDTRRARSRWWVAPAPWSAPRDSKLDGSGDAWNGNMTSDRVLWMVAKGGQFAEYVLPWSTNIRRVFVGISTTPAN
jgi:virginiamycin B lyase